MTVVGVGVASDLTELSTFAGALVEISLDSRGAPMAEYAGVLFGRLMPRRQVSFAPLRKVPVSTIKISNPNSLISCASVSVSYLLTNSSTISALVGKGSPLEALSVSLSSAARV